MPKILPYPLDALRKCLELADAVNDAGGVCEKSQCAEKLGKSLSGAFQTLIGSTVKYGLLTNTKHTLSTTAMYTEIMLAHNNNEKEDKKRQAFMNIPVFNRLLKQYQNRVIPIENLTPILIKEHQVDEHRAETVARVFIEGAIYLGLIGADFQVAVQPEEFKVIPKMDSVEQDTTEEHFDVSEFAAPKLNGGANETVHNIYKEFQASTQDSAIRQSETLQEGLKDLYTVNISGPGIETTLSVEDETDVVVLQAITQKLKSKVLNRALSL